MRIISGKYRGLNLVQFKGEEIRPTADRVKESLFNIIYGKIAGAVVLDLFCGSGNLGIECLSRGAAEVNFNDVSASSLTVLKKNLAKLKGEDSYFITAGDYLNFLQSSRKKFDLIFIDPPYAAEFGYPALKEISSRKLLNSGGVAIYERDRLFEGEIEGLEITDRRKYGKTYLTFFTPCTEDKV
ncbi:MAG: 16S rRNA (guanine(966)-N(2))-methyltransferase RsmD [Candidatus Coproplasma sp.]